MRSDSFAPGRKPSSKLVAQPQAFTTVDVQSRRSAESYVYPSSSGPPRSANETPPEPSTRRFWDQRLIPTDEPSARSTLLVSPTEFPPPATTATGKSARATTDEPSHRTFDGRASGSLTRA